MTDTSIKYSIPILVELNNESLTDKLEPNIKEFFDGFAKTRFDTDYGNPLNVNFTHCDTAKGPLQKVNSHSYEAALVAVRKLFGQVSNDNCHVKLEEFNRIRIPDAVLDQVHLTIYEAIIDSVFIVDSYLYIINNMVHDASIKERFCKYLVEQYYHPIEVTSSRESQEDLMRRRKQNNLIILSTVFKTKSDDEYPDLTSDVLKSIVMDLIDNINPKDFDNLAILSKIVDNLRDRLIESDPEFKALLKERLSPIFKSTEYTPTAKVYVMHTKLT